VTDKVDEAVEAILDYERRVGPPEIRAQGVCVTALLSARVACMQLVVREWRGPTGPRGISWRVGWRPSPASMLL
jgi:hypothetical protein